MATTENWVHEHQKQTEIRKGTYAEHQVVGRFAENKSNRRSSATWLNSLHHENRSGRAKQMVRKKSRASEPSDQTAQRLRSKLRAAAYGTSGVDFEREFHRFDLHRTGSLSFNDFVLAVRKLCPLTAADATVFARLIDADKNGRIDYNELINFIFGRSEDATQDKPPEESAAEAIATQTLELATKVTNECAELKQQLTEKDGEVRALSAGLAITQKRVAMAVAKSEGLQLQFQAARVEHGKELQSVLEQTLAAEQMRNAGEAERAALELTAQQLRETLVATRAQSEKASSERKSRAAELEGEKKLMLQRLSTLCSRLDGFEQQKSKDAEEIATQRAALLEIKQQAAWSDDNYVSERAALQEAEVRLKATEDQMAALQVQYDSLRLQHGELQEAHRQMTEQSVQAVAKAAQMQVERDLQTEQLEEGKATAATCEQLERKVAALSGAGIEAEAKWVAATKALRQREEREAAARAERVRRHAAELARSQQEAQAEATRRDEAEQAGSAALGAAEAQVAALREELEALRRLQDGAAAAEVVPGSEQPPGTVTLADFQDGLADITADRDSLRARVAELEASVPPPADTGAAARTAVEGALKLGALESRLAEVLADNATQRAMSVQLRARLEARQRQIGEAERASLRAAADAIAAAAAEAEALKAKKAMATPMPMPEAGADDAKDARLEELTEALANMTAVVERQRAEADVLARQAATPPFARVFREPRMRSDLTTKMSPLEISAATDATQNIDIVAAANNGGSPSPSPMSPGSISIMSNGGGSAPATPPVIRSSPLAPSSTGGSSEQQEEEEDAPVSPAHVISGISASMDSPRAASESPLPVRQLPTPSSPLPLSPLPLEISSPASAAPAVSVSRHDSESISSSPDGSSPTTSTPAESGEQAPTSPPKTKAFAQKHRLNNKQQQLLRQKEALERRIDALLKSNPRLNPAMLQRKVVDAP